MNRLVSVFTGLTLLVVSPTPLHAHSDGVFSIHEVAEATAPKVSLEVEKDPTGGLNVRVLTSNFVWRPEMASKQHVDGEGHAHVYLDGRKIMRIYNQWFHLNTFQFATVAGEQLLSIELVGNDHAPYTLQGIPVGSEQIISVPSDEIQPKPVKGIGIEIYSGVFLVVLIAGILFWRRFQAPAETERTSKI